MYAKVIIKAVLAALASLCASLVLLFTANGVTQFADISEVSYAVAIITALATGISILSTSLNDSPANIKQTNSIVEAAANLNIPLPEKTL